MHNGKLEKGKKKEESGETELGLWESLVSAWSAGWGGISTITQTTEWFHLEVRSLGLSLTLSVSSLASHYDVPGGEWVLQISAHASPDKTTPMSQEHFSGEGYTAVNLSPLKHSSSCGVVSLGKAPTSPSTQVFQRPSVYYRSLPISHLHWFKPTLPDSTQDMGGLPGDRTEGATCSFHQHMAPPGPVSQAWILDFWSTTKSHSSTSLFAFKSIFSPLSCSSP